MLLVTFDTLNTPYSSHYNVRVNCIMLFSIQYIYIYIVFVYTNYVYVLFIPTNFSEINMKNTMTVKIRNRNNFHYLFVIISEYLQI